MPNSLDAVRAEVFRKVGVGRLDHSVRFNGALAEYHQKVSKVRATAETLEVSIALK